MIWTAPDRRSGRSTVCGRAGAAAAAMLIGFVLPAGVGHAADPGLALIAAAKRGDSAEVEALLRQGARVDATEGDGSTALLWASYRDDGATADKLIAAGAAPGAANDLGATPLWAASQNGSAAMVRRLLAAGADPNRALTAGETPLMVASRSGSGDVVRALAEAGADVNAAGARGQTALMWAVAQQHADVVAILIAHGADVRARSSVWRQVMAVPPHGLPQYNRSIPHGGDTALMFAARVGDVASARLLVAAGADVNDRDAWNVSAVTLAAHSGFADVVEFLLERGADANAAGPGFTALHEAVMRRDTRMAKALLRHGADPNARLATWTPTRRSSRDWNFDPMLVGATPFWLAARFADPEMMRVLMTHGADPRFVHHASYHAGDPAEPRTQVTTALMAAAGMGGGAAWVQPDRSRREALTLEAVTLAASTGIDLDAANVDGRTALDAARAARLESVVQFLIARGAKSGVAPAP